MTLAPDTPITEATTVNRQHYFRIDGKCFSRNDCGEGVSVAKREFLTKFWE